MDDQQALTYADANQIPQPTLQGVADAAAPNDQDAIVEQLQMAAPVAASSAVTEEVTKTPKPKQTRKRKSTAVEGEDGEASAVKTATPASPDKKRKRASKAADTPAEEPKKSGRKKKTA
jgi:hypothetical protein